LKDALVIRARRGDGRMSSGDRYSDAYLRFAHVVWSPDSNVVGLILKGGISVNFAFRFSDMQQVPFDLIAPEMMSDITAQYARPKSLVPFDCKECFEMYRVNSRFRP
jgi:hypothetical protein